MRNITINDDTCMRMLGRALSRYNGLTNSAKLELISKVVAGNAEDDGNDIFAEKPFRYAHEVIKEFERSVKSRSAEVHLHHAIAFGFLYRATPGETRRRAGLVNRQESTSHISLSPLGRAFRSASILKEKAEDFKAFIWNFALLECDFDMYGLLLKMSEENGGRVIGLEEFITKFYSLRKEQVKWMRKKFSYAGRREQIQRKIQWIGHRSGVGKRGHKREFKVDEIFEFGGKSPNHHYAQRLRWAVKFNHVDKNKKHLTDAGRLLASCLPSTNDKPFFFWLGPPVECANSRFLASANIPKKQCSPAWNLLVCQSNNKAEEISEQFVDKLAAYMKDAFDTIRLINFSQATLDTVLPYVHFLERDLGERVDEKKLFRDVFARHRDELVCALRGNLSKSHYWPRQKK